MAVLNQQERKIVVCTNPRLQHHWKCILSDELAGKCIRKTKVWTINSKTIRWRSRKKKKLRTFAVFLNKLVLMETKEIAMNRESKQQQEKQIICKLFEIEVLALPMNILAN